MMSSEQNNTKMYHLQRFRELGVAALAMLERAIGRSNHKELAAEINKTIQKYLNDTIKSITQTNLSATARLEAMLAAHYAADVVMLELRNEVWAYEYMAFSRRIGELWEDFVRVVFDYSPNEIHFFQPPLFSQVRNDLKQEVVDFVNSLSISEQQKLELLRYYEKVWFLVDSGQISLELDLHFIQRQHRYNIDFKSGFGSNEKGNTNRLLMVAAIYKNLSPDYTNLLLVRTPEDQNNHYFKILRDSGVWEAHCGQEAYNVISTLCGFDITAWINANID